MTQAQAVRNAICYPIAELGDIHQTIFPDGSSHTFQFRDGFWVELSSAELSARKIASLRSQLAEALAGAA